MDDTERKSRRGTEVRRRTGVITFRATEAERAELEGKAEKAGVSLGSFIRASALSAPTTRAARRPAIEVQAVTRLQGEMNKIGSNIHQILRRVNFGDTPPAEEFREALSGYREVIAAILAALGRGQGRI